MSNIFTKGQPTQREIYEQKYRTCRINLLAVVIFTAINLLLLVTNADSYFLFSAFIPYFITSVGMLVCGLFPDEFYTGELAGMEFLDTSVFAVLLIISIVLTLLYLLAWVLSSKHRVGWLIFALVFFALDTLGMIALSDFSFELIVDIAFHAWVIYYLVLGITVHHKLKNLPPEEEAVFSAVPSEGQAEGEENDLEPAPEGSDSSPILRAADMETKHRVLATASVYKYDICYRRVKHTNELVINGNVYDELSGIIEHPHTLEAQIDGHIVIALYNGTHSIILVDGETVVKKIRWY